jgi:P-type E1-E2 ATPase
MTTHGVDTRALAPAVAEWAAAGVTPVHVAVDGCLAGAIGIADRIKSGAVEAIRQLQGMGLDVIIVTGDHRATAEAVGRAAGIEQAVAEALPHRKVAEVRRLQAEGRIVAMVGDGINDAWPLRKLMWASRSGPAPTSPSMPAT